MSDGGKFDPRVVDFRRPIEAAFKIGGWIFVAPTIAAVIWGIYTPNNIMGVIGISGRRAAGGFIEGSRPIGESLMNASEGKGLRPGGTSYQEDTQGQSIRPGNQHRESTQTR